RGRTHHFKPPARGGVFLVKDPCPRPQCLHAGGFDIGDMHKNIGAAASGRMKPNPRSVLKNLARPVGIVSRSSSAQWTRRPAAEKGDEIPALPSITSSAGL